MRKILAVLAAGLFVFSLAACGGGSSKAKTASSDSDRADSDSSDSKSSSKSSSSKSSSSKSSSSSSGGATADAYCAEIQRIGKLFGQFDKGLPSDDDIETLIQALRDLREAAPSEIQADMKTFIDIEIRAATAAKGAANNSDAQESAAGDVLSDAGDDFLNAVTKVDQFTTDTCGFDISGETSSDFSTVGSSIN